MDRHIRERTLHSSVPTPIDNVPLLVLPAKRENNSGVILRYINDVPYPLLAKLVY